MQKKGVIFDLDGTILDSMDIWKEIDVKFLGRRGLEVPDDYFRNIAPLGFDGAAAYTIERFGFPETPEQIIEEWYQMAVDAYAKEVELKPFAKEYLLFLKEQRVKLGIATSCETQMFLPALERNGILGLFESYTTVREVPRGKEFPDIYERQAEKMGLLPGECAVFEDILKAVQGANAGGFYTVGVFDLHSAYEWGEIKKQANKFIYSYEELIR
nr:HAD family phosphatase [uncultured Faecalimonas sp.]